MTFPEVDILKDLNEAQREAVALAEMIGGVIDSHTSL